MQLRMRMHNKEDGEDRYYKDIELPFLPPAGMYLNLGEMPNGDIIAGWVTDLEHDFRNGVTYFTCLINDPDEDMDEFARHDNWEHGRG